MSERVYPTPSPFPRWIMPTILVVLIAAISAPMVAERVAERVQYGLTRGEQRARADVARGQLAGLTETAAAFRLVAQSVGPSVVHIDTLQRVRFNGTDEYESLFGAPEGYQAGQGSGVIVDASGFIVTNFHVIDNAEQIEIKLSDGTTISDQNIEHVGVDPANDLAVLKINIPAKLIPAPWGDSNELEVGDWVVAVGNPFGLDRTVTAGIVSAKDRRGVNNLYQEFLQTDAAVNPGNSGGPLVDLQGRIVGINTAIVGEAYQGISFAIPSNQAQKVYEQLRQSGTPVRGWLGVKVDSLNPEIALRLGLTSTKGVYVDSVIPGQPAHKAGMQAYDVIIGWNGHALESLPDLGSHLIRTKPGDEVRLTVLRDQRQIEIAVIIEARPAELP